MLMPRRSSIPSAPTLPPRATAPLLSRSALDAGALPTGDPEARNEAAVAMLAAASDAPEPERGELQRRVVLAYLDVAEAVASRYRSRAHDWNDLRQVAFVGLTKAVHRFEPSRGADLISFAVPTIAGEIKRYIRDTSWSVRPPRRLQELYVRVVAEAPRLAQSIGRSPTTHELAAHLGETPELVVQAIECAHDLQPESLDAPRGDADGDQPVTLGDSIGVADDGLARAELVATLRWACRVLTPRERRIVYLRFFEDRTQAEIAAELGVTQMQVSRLLAKILATLRLRLVPDGSIAA